MGRPGLRGERRHRRYWPNDLVGLRACRPAHPGFNSADLAGPSRPSSLNRGGLLVCLGKTTGPAGCWRARCVLSSLYDQVHSSRVGLALKVGAKILGCRCGGLVEYSVIMRSPGSRVGICTC
jgi:hypothetical protein